MIRRPVKEVYINDVWNAIPYKNNKDKIRITKELEANREISAEKINKIKSLQNDVLVLHQDTQKNVQELDALMEGLEKAAAEAVAQWKSHKIFDPRIAKKALSSFDFRSAPQLAQKAVDLQKRTVEELRGLIAETGKTM